MALDPGWLLSSLAQSTAAVVAIVGGFLVSRLVQLSSEREGLRRQLQHTLDELAHVNKAYAALNLAHRRPSLILSRHRGRFLITHSPLLDRDTFCA